MARSLGTSIAETMRLVGYSRLSFVNTYGTWVNDGEPSNRRHDFGRSCYIKKKDAGERPAW